MLTRLQGRTDDPLFVRTSRGIVPTQRALALAPTLKRVLGDIQIMLQPTSFDPATATYLRWSVAATDYALRGVPLPFLRQLRQLAPGIQVVAHLVEDAAVYSQLERGELDLALMTRTPPRTTCT